MDATEEGGAQQGEKNRQYLKDFEVRTTKQMIKWGILGNAIMTTSI